LTTHPLVSVVSLPTRAARAGVPTPCDRQREASVHRSD
jgi:hypothetical protein